MPIAEIEAALRGLPGWSLVEEGRAIHRRYRFRNFADAFDFTSRIARLAEAADHHPDLGLGWGYVTVRLQTHDLGGLGPKDFKLAAQIEAAAPATLGDAS